MLTCKTLGDVDVAGKRVLVRVDFNVPLNSQGEVTDDTRIRAALPTISYLIEHDARVILITHVGRPQCIGHEDGLTTKPCATTLSALIGKDVTYVDDLTGARAQEAASRLQDGEIMILDNIRFDAREQQGDPELARELAALGDIYVDDAFGTSHRDHASISGVPRLIPGYAGLLLQREVETLSNLMENPDHPFVAILGGSKVSDKIGAIEKLLTKVDVLILGGGMCFTFLKACGHSVGTSLLQEDWVEKCKELIDQAKAKGVKLLLPCDVVVANAFAEDAHVETVMVDEMPDDMMGLDIGPKSVDLFAQEIAQAKTIFWNGPMGVFEMKPFEAGTKGVAQAVAASPAVSVIGGGDSVAALEKFGLSDQVSYISTGGGASMRLIEGALMPGIESLK